MRDRLLGLFQQKEKSLVELSQDQSVVIAFHKEQVQSQVSLTGLTKEDLKVVKQLQPILVPRLEEVVSGFYSQLLEIPVLNEIIYAYSSPEKLKARLIGHVAEMLNGELDEAYLEKRMKIARVHYQIDLEPQWYMAAFQLLQNGILELVYDEMNEKADYHRFVTAITRIFNFEQQLVLEEYHKSYLRGISEENALVRKEVKSKIGMTSEGLVAISEETQATMDELLGSSDEMAEVIKKTAQQSLDTQQLATEGEKQIALMNKRIQEIQASAEEMRSMILQLDTSSKAIENVVNIVEGIANQTNLLSLNASIEAARAGASGQGFAVVAGEIRKLSEETKNSVTQIMSLIERNSEYVEGTVEALGMIGEKIDEGSENFAVTKTTFEHIVSSMEESLSYVEQVVADIDTLTSRLHTIGNATDNIQSSAETLNETALSL